MALFCGCCFFAKGLARRQWRSRCPEAKRWPVSPSLGSSLLRVHLSACSVLHAPSFWRKRQHLIFLVHNKELEVQLAWVSAWGPLFILERVRKKQVGGACFPGYVEEDRALGPSCGHWSPGLERKMVLLRSGWPHCKEEGDKMQLRKDWGPAPDRWQAECHDCTIVKGHRILLFSNSWDCHLESEVIGGLGTAHHMGARVGLLPALSAAWKLSPAPLSCS